jgi:DNA polymerase III epsilon subunit-like protein
MAGELPLGGGVDALSPLVAQLRATGARVERHVAAGRGARGRAVLVVEGGGALDVHPLLTPRGEDARWNHLLLEAACGGVEVDVYLVDPEAGVAAMHREIRRQRYPLVGDGPAVVSIDLETTGQRRPVEIALVLLYGGEVVGTWSTLIRQPRSLLESPKSYHANRIHQIPLEEIARAPNDEAAVAARVRRFLGAWAERYGQVSLTAWNISFERSVLKDWRLEAEESGVTWGQCAMRRAKSACPDQGSKRGWKLARAVEYFDGELVPGLAAAYAPAHRALPDALAAALIWLHLDGLDADCDGEPTATTATTPSPRTATTSTPPARSTSEAVGRAPPREQGPPQRQLSGQGATTRTATTSRTATATATATPPRLPPVPEDTDAGALPGEDLAERDLTDAPAPSRAGGAWPLLLIRPDPAGPPRLFVTSSRRRQPKAAGNAWQVTAGPWVAARGHGTIPALFPPRRALQAISRARFLGLDLRGRGSQRAREALQTRALAEAAVCYRVHLDTLPDVALQPGRLCGHLYAPVEGIEGLVAIESSDVLWMDCGWATAPLVERLVRAGWRVWRHRRQHKTSHRRTA